MDEDKTKSSRDCQLLEELMRTPGVRELLNPDLLAEIEGFDVSFAGPWCIERAPAAFDPEDELYCVPASYWMRDDDDKPGGPPLLCNDGYDGFPNGGKADHCVVLQYRFLELGPAEEEDRSVPGELAHD